MRDGVIARTGVSDGEGSVSEWAVKAMYVVWVGVGVGIAKWWVVA